MLQSSLKPCIPLSFFLSSLSSSSIPLPPHVPSPSSIQRQVFSALSQISKHSVDLAEMVVEAEIFPAVLACLRDPDEYVRKNVTTLMREITKHTPEVHPHTPNIRGTQTLHTPDIRTHTH